MKIYLSGTLALCLLAGCSGTQDTGADVEATAPEAATAAAAETATAEPNAPTDAAGYLAKAGASDMFEIESSRAILAKSPDKAVADFANMMIKHHTESTAKLKAAAEEAGMTVPPPVMDAAQRAKVEGIKSASGEAATTAYLASQREAHPMALALHQAYAAGGDTPSLKTAAGEIVPVVQMHIEALAKLPGA